MSALCLQSVFFPATLVFPTVQKSAFLGRLETLILPLGLSVNGVCVSCDELKTWGLFTAMALDIQIRNKAGEMMYGCMTGCDENNTHYLHFCGGIVSDGKTQHQRVQS